MRAVCIGLVLMASAATAQDCADPKTERDAHSCAMGELAAAQEEKEQAFASLIPAIKRLGAEVPAGDTSPGQALISADQAWTKYVQYSCTANVWLAKGHKPEPAEYSSCMAARTRERAAELRGLARGD